jgi:pyridoxamine 5'-phosphate oxidase
MQADDSSLGDVLQTMWTRLGRAVDQSDDPCRTPALGTCDAGGSHSRIVVLRGIDTTDRSLLAYTDIRSEKVRQMACRSRVSWLFWDASGRTQTRMEGEVCVHSDDALAESEWARCSDVNRRLYEGPPPGTAGTDSNRSARENFSVVRCVVDRIDWLDLNAPGHRRAIFVWRGDQWQGRWVSS